MTARRWRNEISSSVISFSAAPCRNHRATASEHQMFFFETREEGYKILGTVHGHKEQSCTLVYEWFKKNQRKVTALKMIQGVNSHLWAVSEAWRVECCARSLCVCSCLQSRENESIFVSLLLVATATVNMTLSGVDTTWFSFCTEIETQTGANFG